MPRLNYRFFLALLTLLPLLSLSFEAGAVATDAQNYRNAFSTLDAGHAEAAYTYALHGHDAVLNKVLKSSYMAQPNNVIGFTEMADFINHNPDWPHLKGIIAIAEQKLPPSMSPTEVVNWFTTYPPVTVAGFGREMEALEALGETQNIPALVRERWTDGEFSNDELATFHTRYNNILGPDASWQRLDHLLWKNDSTGARRIYPYVDEGMRAVADARLALANQNRNAETFVNNVPSEWRSEPGLLYELLRWNIHNNYDDQANDLLLHAPEKLGKADAWWDLRQTMIHRAIEKRDFNLAYKLADEHGQTDSKTLTQGEFLAGWIALRFLNQPEIAHAHFESLYENASTPISRARGAYWLGRTYEVLGNKNDAEQSYESAAALNITYYGQLASARLYEAPVINATPEPKIPSSVRQVFFNHDLIRAVERLNAIGEVDRARSFFHAEMEAATQRSDFALLTELAYQIGRPDLAIEAAKAANQKNMLMASGGFPLLTHSLPQTPEPAFIHALIRQESMFNPKAHSPVGANGLMQLMPETAKAVARKLGIKFKESKLGDEDYNIRLGTTFVQNQLAIFNGSYVLALAGYNAGPHRVHQWMDQIGDPRNPDVDPIDWIEMIPITETRNYVQRIIESLQIYRARLGGGQAPLLILNDLKR